MHKKPTLNDTGFLVVPTLHKTTTIHPVRVNDITTHADQVNFTVRFRKLDGSSPTYISASSDSDLYLYTKTHEDGIVEMNRFNETYKNKLLNLFKNMNTAEKNKWLINYLNKHNVHIDDYVYHAIKHILTTHQINKNTITHINKAHTNHIITPDINKKQLLSLLSTFMNEMEQKHKSGETITLYAYKTLTDAVEPFHIITTNIQTHYTQNRDKYELFGYFGEKQDKTSEFLFDHTHTFRQMDIIRYVYKTNELATNNQQRMQKKLYNYLNNHLREVLPEYNHDDRWHLWLLHRIIYGGQYTLYPADKYFINQLVIE